MRACFFLVSSFVFLSCTNEANNGLSASDSLSITFKAIESGAIIKTMSTTDEKAIKKLANYIKGDTDKEYKCGYDGELSFYEKGRLTGKVSFNYSQEGCLHFSQTEGATLKTTKMNNEAVAFLKGLAEGKSWY